jgi:hypothetical protein
MLSLNQPKAPLAGGLVRRPDARSQSLEFNRPPEHIECSVLPSLRDKLAVHNVGANERAYQRMECPDHRQRILPRTVKACGIRNQNGSAGGKEQKVGHFYRAGAMQADALQAEHRREKTEILVKATEKDTVHSPAC